MKKDFQTHQMVTPLKEMITGMEARLQRIPNEMNDRNLNQHSEILRQYHSAILELQKIFEVLLLELKDYPDDLPTSFVAVETTIAKCISECLPDVPEQNRNISDIQALLRGYRVVRLVHGKNPSVSLHKVHLLLQDNYEGSFLCGLMNMLLAGFMGTHTKVIDF